MSNEISKQCKSKSCYNPVLEGKYCEQCKQKRKEKRDIILAAVGGPTLLGLCVALKKGLIKQAPKIMSEVIQRVSKKS